MLVSTNLSGEQDKAFNGFIRVLDPENNTLTWNINTNNANWSGWSAAPILQDTANPNQKRLYAAKAGAPGTYNISLNVNDGYGGILATVTPIIIGNNPPLIQANDINYYPSVVLPLIINFSITDNDQPVSYTFNKATWNSGPFDLLAPSHAIFLGSSNNRVGNTVYYTLKYNLLTSNSFPTDTNFVYNIGAADKYSNNSDKQINIKIKADPPALDFNCNTNVRVGTQYYCGLGWGKQGDHTITYSVVGTLPPGLSIGEASNLYDPSIGEDITKLNLWQRMKKLVINSWHKISIKANAAPIVSPFYVIKGTPTTASVNNIIKVRAENEFGAVSEKEFVLNINNYCGDGILQTPNTEARGGLYNDGYEDCDHSAGTTNNAGDSHSGKQYCCTTQTATVYPITTTDQCVFSSVFEGGGFCGDGLCSTNFENKTNCNIVCGNGQGTPPVLSLEWGAIDNSQEDGDNDPKEDEGNDSKEDENPGDDATDNNPEDNNRGMEISCEPFDYAGQNYDVALIGDQCWMAENLNIGTYVNSNADQNSSVVTKKYCYNNIQSNCDLYGGLYQWNTVMQSSATANNQGICPDDWHVPTDEDWYVLESGLATSTCEPDRVGAGSANNCFPAGSELKSGDFNADLVGYHINSSFINLNNATYFWTASQAVNPNNGLIRPVARGLFNDNSIVDRIITMPNQAFSLRCVKNN